MGLLDDSVISGEFRPPPSNTLAEKAVLGALLSDAKQLDFVLEIIDEDDLFLQAHRHVFHAIAELQREADIVTVAERLERECLLDECGGMPALADMIESAPPGSNIGAYARIVANCAKARQVIRAAGPMQSADADTWQSVADGVMRDLLALGGIQQRWEHDIDQALTGAIDAVEQALASDGLVGLPTGLARLDSLLGGYHDTDLIIVGARPAMGKTAFALNSLLSVGVPAGLISTEQPADQIAMRMIAIEGRIDGSALRNAKLDDDGWAAVTGATARLKGRPLKINDQPSITISQIGRQARAWRSKHDIKALFVDYVQNIRPDTAGLRRHEQVGEVISGLKQIARELCLPVIALSQVSRDVEQRQNKRPRMGDLSDSSQIEKDADCVLLLYRDEVYNPDTPDSGIVEILLDKNRHGPTGFTKAAWVGHCMRFENLARRDDER